MQVDNKSILAKANEKMAVNAGRKKSLKAHFSYRSDHSVIVDQLHLSSLRPSASHDDIPSGTREVHVIVNGNQSLEGELSPACALPFFAKWHIPVSLFSSPNPTPASPR